MAVMLLKLLWSAVVGAILLAGSAGFWIYISLYGRPTDAFEPRRHGVRMMQTWKEDFRRAVLGLTNSLQSDQVARLDITDDQVDAFLHSDAPALVRLFGVDVPQEIGDLQVDFNRGRIRIRFEYHHLELQRVMVSADLRPVKADGGAWKFELSDVRVGRQWIPPGEVLARLRERFPAKSDDEGDVSLLFTTDGGPDVAVPAPKAATRPAGEPLPLGRELLSRVLAGEAVGPVIRLPKLPGAKRRKDVRIREIDVQSGRLVLVLEPVAGGGG